MTRRITPSHKLGKNPRNREREMEDEYWLSDERESFPLFCMTCEKQFVPCNEKAIYCSEACRGSDQGTLSATPRSHAPGARTIPNYPFYAANDPEPRDIIPRASPSRPNSMYMSPPASPDSSTQHTSAISALRSLSLREPSPPSPASSYHTGVWPFSGRNMASSPSAPYGARPASTVYSSTYESYGYTMTSPSTGDRLLPSRRPGVYSRPRSIELVTPTTNSR
ncbi:unnamed protein product [Discula destructiva]